MSRLRLPVMLVAALALPARAADWPLFGRDRTRNAVSLEAGAPTDWQIAAAASKDSPARVARNIRWSAKLGTRSMGGPVRSRGGRVDRERSDENENSAHDRTPESELLGGELSFCAPIFYCARVLSSTVLVVSHKPWLRRASDGFGCDATES